VESATGDCDGDEHFLESTNTGFLEVSHHVLTGKVRNKIAHCSKRGSVQRVRLPPPPTNNYINVRSKADK